MEQPTSDKGKAPKDENTSDITSSKCSGFARIGCEEGHETKRKQLSGRGHTKII